MLFATRNAAFDVLLYASELQTSLPLLLLRFYPHVREAFELTRICDLGDASRSAPSRTAPLQVLSLGLHGYSDGLYFVDDLGIVEEGTGWRTATFPPPRVALEEVRFSELLDSADALLLSSLYQLTPQHNSQLNRCFRREHKYYGGYRVPHYSVYLRRDSCPNPEALQREN